MTNIRTINEWETDGEITPELLLEWAYDENAIFMSQDEDLLLHDIELLPHIIKLIADLNCPKREYLVGIISYYTTLNFRHKRTTELNLTREIISHNKSIIAGNLSLESWAKYVQDSFELITNNKNITKVIAEKYGWAILKGPNGYADLTPAKLIDDSTWEIIYLAPSVKPYIHINIKSGEYKYMGYK